METTKKKDYWKGRKNIAIRYYYYATKGLQLLNPFRYYVAIAFLLYHALKLDNFLYLVLIIFFGIPVLIYLGHLSVHYMEKVIEWLAIQFSTVWSKRNYELNEERNEILKEIKNELGKDQETIEGHTL